MPAPPSWYSSKWKVSPVGEDCQLAQFATRGASPSGVHRFALLLRRLDHLGAQEPQPFGRVLDDLGQQDRPSAAYVDHGRGDVERRAGRAREEVGEHDRHLDRPAVVGRDGAGTGQGALDPAVVLRFAADLGDEVVGGGAYAAVGLGGDGRSREHRNRDVPGRTRGPATDSGPGDRQALRRALRRRGRGGSRAGEVADRDRRGDRPVRRGGRARRDRGRGDGRRRSCRDGRFGSRAAPGQQGAAGQQNRPDHQAGDHRHSRAALARAALFLMSPPRPRTHSALPARPLRPFLPQPG